MPMRQAGSLEMNSETLLAQHACGSPLCHPHRRRESENRLHNVDPDRANLTHGRLPSMWLRFDAASYNTSCRSGRRPPSFATDHLAPIPTSATHPIATIWRLSSLSVRCQKRTCSRRTPQRPAQSPVVPGQPTRVLVFLRLANGHGRPPS